MCLYSATSVELATILVQAWPTRRFLSSLCLKMHRLTFHICMKVWKRVPMLILWIGMANCCLDVIFWCCLSNIINPSFLSAFVCLACSSKASLCLAFLKIIIIIKLLLVLLLFISRSRTSGHSRCVSTPSSKCNSNLGSSIQTKWCYHKLYRLPVPKLNLQHQDDP